ncbi:hypothetical protein EC957_001911 [Mortierella hygrophila]|uniref:Uncharacterized protein n=1 Tax=Mortierella hygrophila TaxID=979708 RepID=A0A9P6F575_9FUNG|nr:hypothetical protein EC957_001911 [Mortierella hygrophila]
MERLEGIQSQDLPVFGVSGMMRENAFGDRNALSSMGFYFNPAKSDLGSSDLSQLTEFIDAKTTEKQGPRQNTAFARNMTLVLFLSQLMVLKYCLKVPGCRQTFSSAIWTIRQVCAYTLKDVFSELFNLLCIQLRVRVLFELVLTTVIQNEFLVVRDLLTSNGYPNFLVGSKLRLVVDETQVLSDKGNTKFQSFI